MTNIHEIKDFREAVAYRHAKLITQNVENTSDESITVFSLYKEYASTRTSRFATLKDIHVFSGQDSIDITTGRTAMYDGIYDIWLRNCNNVKTVSMCFNNNNIEIPIPNFAEQKDESIQIPLTFALNGKPVNHVFFDSEPGWFPKRNLSFIPTVALPFDKLSIKLNTGASCDVHISTIYFQTLFRREIVQSTCKFYVNGVPLLARSGIVQQCTKENENCCIIC